MPLKELQSGDTFSVLSGNVYIVVGHCCGCVQVLPIFNHIINKRIFGAALKSFDPNVHVTQCYLEISLTRNQE